MTQPIVLMTSAAGADLAKPGDAGAAGGKPVKGRPQMDKAQLTLYDPSPSPSGGGDPGAKRGTVPFQFNPKEVTITKSAKWERKTTKGSKTAGPPEFTGPEPSKMTLEMFFDATSTQDGSVVKAVETLLSCCVATEKSAGQKKPSPPIVVLHWGSISSFPAFVTSVSAKFTLFSSDGTPDPCCLQREPGGDAGREIPEAKPHIRRTRRPPGTPHDRRRQLGLGGVRRVRRPQCLATPCCIQRD
jgi:hypothetical protein